MRQIIIAITASVFLSAAAQAAMVQALDAPVFLNRGEGYQEIAGATQAVPGDLVLAGNGGRAQIVYENGCTIPVDSGQTISVAEVAPQCRGAGAGRWLLGAGVVGGAAAAIILLSDDDDDGQPVSP